MTNAMGGNKRPSETPTAGPAKVPKASEVTLMEQSPKPTGTHQRLPGSAPVVVCIYKVTDQAGDVWQQYEGHDDVALWQIQICHDARPSATFGIISSFNEFLKQAHKTNDTLPLTLADLRRAGIMLVLSDQADPDNVGWKQWRVGFYVAGTAQENSLKNFLSAGRFLRLPGEGNGAREAFRSPPSSSHWHRR